MLNKLIVKKGWVLYILLIVYVIYILIIPRYDNPFTHFEKFRKYSEVEGSEWMINKIKTKTNNNQYEKFLEQIILNTQDSLLIEKVFKRIKAEKLESLYKYVKHDGANHG